MRVAVLRKLIAACTPDEPLGPDDPPFSIRRAAPARQVMVCPIGERHPLLARTERQLVTGIRGSGKTTELRALREMLRQTGHHVVIADAGD